MDHDSRSQPVWSEGWRYRNLAQAVTLIVEFSRTATAAAGRAVDPALVQNAPIAVLARLAAGGPLRPRDLRAHVDITAGGLSNLLGRLERAGLVTRGRTATDRRGVVVELTPLGREQVSRLGDAIFASLRANEASIKATVVALVDGGAGPRAVVLPERAPPSIRFVLGLSTIGVALQRALDVDSEGQPTHDANAELVLIMLLELGPCRPRRLAELMAISSAGVSLLLDRVESRRLVERHVGGIETDGRAVEIVLTPAGRLHVHAMLDRMVPHLDEVLAVLRLFLQELHRPGC